MIHFHNFFDVDEESNLSEQWLFHAGIVKGLTKQVVLKREIFADCF